MRQSEKTHFLTFDDGSRGAVRDARQDRGSTVTVVLGKRHKDWGKVAVL